MYNSLIPILSLIVWTACASYGQDRSAMAHGKCVYVYFTPKTVAEAEAACAADVDEGRLAILDNQEIHDALQGALYDDIYDFYEGPDYVEGDYFDYRSFWIGLKMHEEGDFCNDIGVEVIINILTNPLKLL